MRAAGMRSLSLAFPDALRTNDYFRVHCAEAVADAERRSLARLWSTKDGSSRTGAFDEAMAPYLSDPFRGAVARRILPPGADARSLQGIAARDALAAAGIAPRDVGLTIASTFYADGLDVGNAAFLARDLGLGGTCFNLETGCSSSIAALEVASQLVRVGQYQHVLVVTGTRYSHVLDLDDTVGWFLGDGAGAYVVSEVPEGEGFLGSKAIHTADTCGIFYTELVAGREGPARRTRARNDAGKILRDTAAEHLETCVRGALAAAQVELGAIDFFVFQTSTAWFADFAARALGIDRERTISVYPLYANVGSVLMPANLFHAAALGRVKRGDLVLVASLGAVSSANAAVMRWGDVALGPPPAGSGLPNAPTLPITAPGQMTGA